MIRKVTTVLATAALAGAGLAGIGFGGPTEAAAQVVPAHAGSHGPCRNGYVGLTFDDGPSATTDQLLAALRASHLRATMFNIGTNAAANPTLVRAQLRAGMWVGNHTNTHPHLTQIGEPAAFDEIAVTQRTLRGITGRRPTLFRPPFGDTNDQVVADASRLRLLEVLWTVDSEDWNSATTEQIVAKAHTLQPGGIILMHDWPPNTIAAVPLIAQDLRARGLCAGRIAFTPRDIPYGADHVFHAVAVRP